MDFLPIYLLVVINLFVLYLWREDRQDMARERKDLYDRLMAPSLTDYKASVEPEPEQKQEEETVVEIDEAKEEIVNG